jgi:putative ABC transport system substrate-binding protein
VTQDPSATLAVHCGNGFDARFEPLSQYSSEPIQCCPLSLGGDMRRREFTLLGGAAAAWPLTAHAQQPGMPVIGLLSSRSPAVDTPLIAVIRQGLNESGLVEGQNVALDYRWADGQYDRLAALAADLVRRQAAVIVTIGGDVSALAAKAASATIPIVFGAGADPLRSGLVTSVHRPGGNITGVSTLMFELEPKRLGLVRELRPNATTIAVLVDPNSPNAEMQVNDIQAATRSVGGGEVTILNASTIRDIDAAFARLVEMRADALLVVADPIFFNRTTQLVVLAARHAIPTLYSRREFTAAGGLISYGPNMNDSYRLLGVYAARILKGEKPGDLPIQLPTKFELVINLSTAKALGLTVPPTLLARADEVIE